MVKRSQLKRMWRTKRTPLVADRARANVLSSMNNNQQCNRPGSTGKLCGRWVIQSLRYGCIDQWSDIATVAVYLASSDSAWIMGETLRVQGGVR